MRVSYAYFVWTMRLVIALMTLQTVDAPPSGISELVRFYEFVVSPVEESTYKLEHIRGLRAVHASSLFLIALS
jgi:hypothetical protein